MNHDTALEYLNRIGTPLPSAPTSEVLRELQVRHLRTVPFENLSIHLDEPIDLNETALMDKIVRRRRGGFCYELNGLFAGLLHALGFRVTLLAGKVFATDGKLGPPFDHLALAVDLEERWLVDVGFGRFSTYPLRLDATEPQADPSGEFRVVPTPEGDRDVHCDGTPQYRLELRARALTDFLPTCWWQQTSPLSHFTRSLTCSLATANGRVTLSGNRLITTANRERTETLLGDDAAIHDAYRTLFGFELSRLPTVRR
ncbi:arylamine N-acetyltransferase [Pendulispora albinea]|uniref:Arylamine N-acetyltransferase n=1 Tax=Pendulispora albinea TaxID=2741071 RepID=A0ABZ2M1L1_9BACT